MPQPSAEQKKKLRGDLNWTSKKRFISPKKTIILYLNGYNQQNKMDFFWVILNDSQ